MATTQDTAQSQLVHLDLGPRSYDILVEPGLLSRLGPEMVKRLGPGDGRLVAIISNPKVELYHGEGVTKSLEESGFRVLPITLVAGESYKSLQTVRRVYKALHSEAVDRRAIILALGGGVIGDIAGFVAATYNRGLDFVQVPTTLLAQVDSSVGGKTGVNFDSGKNLIGAFYQPRFVAIDPDTLHSLPFRERRSGLAEVIKYGIIHDKAFFEMLRGEVVKLLRLRSDHLVYTIAHSCEIKARVVEQDERDAGLRAILNFGHTIGHALEAITKYRKYRHGEAIAVGMVSAAMIGEEHGVTSPEDVRAIIEILEAADFRVALEPDVPLGGLLRLLAWDKKSVDGTARFVLMNEIGRVTHGYDIPSEVVRRALARQQEL
jgi:3-dehydroquinate synthase